MILHFMWEWHGKESPGETHENFKSIYRAFYPLCFGPRNCFLFITQFEWNAADTAIAELISKVPNTSSDFTFGIN